MTPSHPADTPRPTTRAARRQRGFCHAARLVDDRVRAAGEKRGFATAKVITHWDEIVGADTARIARPLKLGWARGQRSRGLGATLTLAVPGPAAPMVQMMAPRIVERVNAALGFAAVARIALSHGAEPTVATGFAEPGAPFTPAPPHTGPALAERAQALAQDVRDPALRAALEGLGRSVLSRHENTKGLP